VTVPSPAEARAQFGLDHSRPIVNHGSFGATPLSVLQAQDAWRARMEAAPTLFMARVLPDALRAAAAALAGFMGARPQDIAFVTNATAGCSAVINSLPLAAGDDVIVTTHGYRAVEHGVRRATARVGASLQLVDLPFPTAADDLIVATIAGRITPRTRLVIVDHITSPGAAILPVAAIAAACRRHGVPVLVDGAHAPGHLALDLPSLGVDWYAGNAHKWLFAAKGCAFLWAREDRQQGLDPPVVSHGYGQGFAASFDWTGTFDPSAFLTIDTAIAAWHGFGGAALAARNAALAGDAAALVARLLGSPSVSHAPGCGMALVALPVDGPVDPARALALRALLFDEGLDLPVTPFGGRAWLRLSAQVYNTLDDYAQAAAIVARVIPGVAIQPNAR